MAHRIHSQELLRLTKNAANCAVFILMITAQAIADPQPKKPNDDATTKAVAALQGEWVYVSSEVRGKSFDVAEKRIEIEGTSLKDKQTEVASDFVIDAPNGYFDVSLRKKNGNLKDAIGIYELQRDSLKVCFRYNVDGKAVRPTEFKSDNGQPNITVFNTFKRAEASPDGGTNSVRVVVTIPKSGNATFKIGRKGMIPIKAATGESVKLAALKDATTIQKVGNIHFVEWDFQQATAISDFKVVGGGDARLDVERGLLVVGGERGGQFSVPVTMELPIVISYDIDEMDAKAFFEASLGCHYATNDNGYLPFRLKADTGLSGPFKLSASASMWRFQNNKKVDLPFRWLINEKSVSLKDVNDIPFTLDKKDLASGNQFRISFNTEGTIPVALSRLSLSGLIVEWDKTSIVAQPADEPKRDEATAKAIKTMQGEWTCIAAEEFGVALSKTEIKKTDRKMNLKGNHFTMTKTGGDGKRGSYIGTFEIDGSTGEFDFVGKGPFGADLQWIGICETKGDTLKLCYRLRANDQAVRPTEFKTDNDRVNHCLFYTFKRAGG